MLTKQIREMERQAESIEQGKINKQLSELKCVDGLYYVGHLVDLDNSNWVNKDEAIQVLKNLG